VLNFLEQPDALSVGEWLAAVRLDQRRRWRQGERVLAEAYLARIPALQGDMGTVLELVDNEIALRQEQGESPELKEYLLRFPQLAAGLRRRLALHRAVAGGLLQELPGRPATDNHETATAALVPLQQDEQSATLVPRQPAVETLLAEGLAVPGYEIIEELGRGGMGVVYKARHTALKRTVALKMILAGAHAGPAELARFKAEAEAVAHLLHPNIVQIYDVGERAGMPYFSLEFVDGGSLADKLDGKPWPDRPAAELVETLAHAVNYAHKQGVIHRDLKPANVLLTPAGVPKITDFGLAKRLEEQKGLTQTGAEWGHRATWRRNRPRGSRRRSAWRRTCTRWAPYCTSCSRASRRSAPPPPSTRSCLS
jgi:serine/threonine-protein kinase